MQYCNESWSWLDETEGVAYVRWSSLGRRGFGFGNDLMGLMFNVWDSNLKDFPYLYELKLKSMNITRETTIKTMSITRIISLIGLLV
jgi:hypothetical protein